MSQATNTTPLNMTATPLPVYEVGADAATGEWLHEPRATGETVPANEWAARRDIDGEHYDTYESPFDGSARALIVRFVA